MNSPVCDWEYNRQIQGITTQFDKEGQWPALHLLHRLMTSLTSSTTNPQHLHTGLPLCYSKQKNDEHLLLNVNWW